MQHYTAAEMVIARDRSVFAVQEGDSELLATLSITDYKELSLALSTLHDRVLGLLEDLQKAEQRIITLENNLDAFAGAVCACFVGKEGDANEQD